MQLETERLVLRRWQDADRAVLCEINQDPRVMEFFDKQATPPETNAFIDRIEAHFDRHGFGLFAAEHRDDGRSIGFIGLNIPRFEAHLTPCVEIGWRLSAEYWGMGLATEGARETL
ncbi:MAG: GNAT family N-acetyltransferase, partial [bacterium]|nr:GNAT family N-acetyltransferase [bacterium]